MCLTNIEPVLATVIDRSTHLLVQYRERAKDEGQDISNFLSEVVRYPDEQLVAIYQSLVGIDEIKRDMLRKLTLLLFPSYLDNWLSVVYAENPPLKLAQVLQQRYPPACP